MGIFDVFKTKWSAGEMTQNDRKKLFWYLKRKTSYTAWKREAEAFDRFVDIFEKQVKEEPIAKSRISTEPTNWESSYLEIIKAQFLYKKGLSKLRQGDRSVWFSNERGLLNDASDIAQSWHSELVNNGPRVDHFYDGKYVPEMTVALIAFYGASKDAGYLQKNMISGCAPQSWSSMWHDEFAKMPIPQSLPDVPVPKNETLVKTGDTVSVFGIYEPQVKDGCMNYLLSGMPAPKLWISGATPATSQKLPVTWRLLWEDTRYLDQEIPEEEDFYYPQKKKEPSPIFPSIVEDLLSAATNQVCPQDGIWTVTDDPDAKAVLRKGEKLPRHKGRDVTWVRVQ